MSSRSRTRFGPQSRWMWARSWTKSSRCCTATRRSSTNGSRTIRASSTRCPHRTTSGEPGSALRVLGGTLGFYGIENWMGRERWSMLDALFMTVITLSTIGYAEVHPLSDPGRLFAIALILGGVFTFLYTATEIIRSVVSGEVAEML